MPKFMSGFEEEASVALGRSLPFPSLGKARTIQKENIMTTTYKKAGLICAAAATAAVLSAMPVTIERSATTTSGIVLSVNQAKAYYGHYRRVTRRVVRRNVRRCAYGVTCY